MKIWNALIAAILGFLLFVAVLFVNSIMDMSMEGNTLAYPHVGYLIPSIFLSFVLFIVTLIMKKNKKTCQLQMVSLFFYLMVMIFTVIFFPVVPAVCFKDNLYALWARICYIGNMAIPFSWLFRDTSTSASY